MPGPNAASMASGETFISSAMPRDHSREGTAVTTMRNPDRKCRSALHFSGLPSGENFVRLSSKSVHGTSKSYPKYDSLVPGARETELSVNGCGTTWVIGGAFIAA